MQELLLPLVCLLASQWALAADIVDATDVKRGEGLYVAKCGGCHSLDENRIGPRHRGVVDRKVADVADYPYSSPLRSLGGVWTRARLDAWLRGPQDVAPGSAMYFSVSDATERRAIIAYLASQTSGSVRRSALPKPK